MDMLLALRRLLTGKGAWEAQPGDDDPAVTSPGHADSRRRGLNADARTLTATVSRSSFADDNNAFALAMFQQLRERPGNLFFSPFSIRAGIAMSLAGAKGPTAEQIRTALCITSSDEALHAAFAETTRRSSAAASGTVEMRVANSLWRQDGTPFDAAFAKLIAEAYRGEARLVDFAGAADAARVAINRWTEEHTCHRIQDLIRPGGVSSETRLVLANAMYLKAPWRLPFRRQITETQPFYLENGRTVQTPLMMQGEAVAYGTGRGYQAIELAYQGNDLSMLVLLPARRDGLRKLEEMLSARMLRECISGMDLCPVTLFVPRFRITWGSADVSDSLAALGMPLAFRPGQADFSGINGYEPPDDRSLFLSAVFHKAFVEVDEEGTEAAAATAAVAAPTSARYRWKRPAMPVFRADHPFFFAIRERREGAILFAGRVADPTA